MKYNKISIATIAGAALLGISAHAVTVEIDPGKLSAKIPTLTLDNELIIKGHGDVRDINSLRENNIAGVKVVNLSELTIDPLHSDKAVILGRTIFKANHIPSYVFFKSPYEKVILPSTITEIEEGAFSGSEITEITIPEGVTKIGAYAFLGCAQLTSVTLPASLKEIDKSAFAGCVSLNSINLAETQVTAIPEECFSGDIRLQYLEAPNVENVGSRAFSGSGVESLNLPHAQAFAPFALSDMYNLISLNVSPDAKFSEGTLMNCSSLISVNGTPEHLPDLFAANCVNLPVETMIANANTVGKYSLANSGASQIVLGNNLTEIKENAFKGASSLGYIDAKDITTGVPDVHPEAFTGLTPSEITLHVHDDLIDDWKNHPVWGEFNITSAGTTGVDNLPAAGENDIAVSIRDNMLVVDSSDDIRSISIYDLNGKILLTLADCGNHVAVDISEIPKGVNLVSVKTTAGFKGVKIII